MDCAVAEEDAWRLLAPLEAPLARTPNKKRKVGQRVDPQIREERNLVGALCKCGKLDVDKFMLQCDGCDTWFHGECMHVTQQQASRARSWRCNPCAKRYHTAKARFQTYCLCRGPWDGRSFMIACDKCEGWFHGECVGLHVDSLQAGTEAAFRRYHCPSCTAGEPSMPHMGSRCDADETAHTPARGRSAQAVAAVAAVCQRFAEVKAIQVLQMNAASPVAATAAGSTLVSLTSATSSPSDAALVPSPLATVTAAAARSTETGSGSADWHCPLFEILTDDAFSAVLGALPLASLLLSAAPVATRLAALAEVQFREFCTRHHWRPQRRQRDHPFAWRLLIRQRACAVCLEPEARFPVRRLAGGTAGGPPLFRLCQQCARREKVQHQVLQHRLEVDAIGEHGRALFARQFHIPLFGHADGFSTNTETKVHITGL